jgi:hypothetical protein
MALSRPKHGFDSRWSYSSLPCFSFLTELKDTALPGFGFHPLKGDRKGEYAITVTGNYRMTFRFENGDVLDLNLEDYH